jgi:glycosyltransferase involved in cell wall biosynthesis
LLTVSRLSKGKNITDLLIILKKVLNMGHDVKLIIVGDGPEKARINNKVSSLGLTDNVKMTGKIERNQIIDYFDISDCFVFTSNEESFGRVLIEANARKKVCISYKNGGSEEVIQDGYNGFLINQGDIDLFSLKIGFLIENKTVLDKMSINSFIFARNLYSSNVVINKYNKILDNI